jgi:hypothetical protein
MSGDPVLPPLATLDFRASIEGVEAPPDIVRPGT